MNKLRTRSPRFPNENLEEAIDKATKLHEANKTYETQHDVTARSLGYKSSNNGAYKKAIAALGYYGLAVTNRGKVSVTKDFVTYLMAPDDKTKKEYLIKFMRGPKIFDELLTKYEKGLPSFEAIRYELIDTYDFNSESADKCAKNFTLSYDLINSSGGLETLEADTQEGLKEPPPLNATPTYLPEQSSEVNRTQIESTIPTENSGSDIIPIRLKGGRKAFLTIPYPLYENDKQQIEAILRTIITEDEER